MNLCKMLMENGNDVTVFGHASAHMERLKRYAPELHVIENDFGTDIRYEDYLKDVDVVFHLISTTKPSNKDVMKEFTTNVLPTVRLLDACVKTKTKLVYFSSGGTVYGNPRYIPIDEGHRTEPISAYGIHKLTEEKCIEYYGRTYGLDYQILRISNPYGPWQDIHGSQGAIAIFLAKVLCGETIELWGDGSAIRDYIYVDDVMNAVRSLMDYKGMERVFNIGSGKGCSLKELFYHIQKITGIVTSIHQTLARIQDVPANVLDISRIRKETGWEPKVSMDQGIRKMMDMWNPAMKGYFPG